MTDTATERPAAPVCPGDGTEAEMVLYMKVRHFRCPQCRVVYYSVSGQVGDARGRIPQRRLRSPAKAAGDG